MARLRLDGVTKRFTDEDEGTVTAVNNVSFDVPDGEFLVIVGPSGCGKTTTLRMIAGLESVTEGEIRLDGTVINDQRPQYRDIAMVFQSYALYPHMSVRENMAFGLEESTDLPSNEISNTVEETAELLGIDSLLDRKPQDLSGGQQQRVALGRAIVRDPEIFLLDEPLANLDAKLRAQMRTELQRLQENLGTTTIYVTHDQTEAMTMGDRIAILQNGELQQIGTPSECYHAPSNAFVAGFIGEPSMNLIEGERNGATLQLDLLSYELSDDLRTELGGSDRIIFGVRPDTIELVETVAGPHDFECSVDVVEPVGKETYVYLKPDPGIDQSIVAIVEGTHPVEEGQQVVARIPEHVLHLFDGESGETLRNRQFLNEETPTEEPL